MPDVPVRTDDTPTNTPTPAPLVADMTPGPPFTYAEPTTGTPHFDNPKNPRGVPSMLCDGAADAQATDAQKVQNPTPQRQPIAANVFPDPLTNQERVSAGQNRKPPQEVIPVLFWLLLVPALIEPLL